MSEPRVEMKLAWPDNVEMTLTLTLPVVSWRHVASGGYHSTFDRAVSGALAKVSALSTSTAVEEDGR